MGRIVRGSLRWVCLGVVAILRAAPSPVAADTLEVTYLGNEGFLLRSGEQAVLVDAVYGEGLKGYPVVAAEVRQAIEGAEPPFDGIDLILASHVHPDHFDAASMSRFLSASPQALFVSTPQAVDRLRAMDRQAPARALYPKEGASESLSVGGIGLKVFNLHHGRGEPVTQNLGLVMEICGITVLHVGDTEANAAEMVQAGLERLSPDLVLLPEWILRGRQWHGAVEDVIQPERIVAMHLPASDAPANYFYDGASNPQETAAIIRQRFPGTWIPLETWESISVPCDVP